MATSAEFFVADMQRDRSGHQVKADLIAVMDQSDRAAEGRLGGAVNSNRSVRDTRDTRVGDQRDLAVEFGNGECRRSQDNLGHPGGDGALIPQHDDVARANAALFDRVGDIASALKADRRATEARFTEARHLEDDAVGSEIAETDLHVGEGLERRIDRREQVLSDGRVARSAYVFGNRAAGHGETTAVDHAGSDEMLQQHRRSAELVQIHHRLRPARGEAAQHRCLLEKAL